MARLSSSLIIFSLLLLGACRGVAPSAGTSALPGSCHAMCGVEEIVVPDTVESEADAPQSDGDSELELPTQRGCSCVESCFREGVCCEDYGQYCGPFHSQSVDRQDLALGGEEHRLYLRAVHHRRLLSVEETNSSMEMAANDSDSGDSNTTETEPMQPSTGSVPVPTSMAATDANVSSPDVSPSSTPPVPSATSSTPPPLEATAKTEQPSAVPGNTSTTNQTAGGSTNGSANATDLPPPPPTLPPLPQNRTEREELLNASMSYLFIDSNVTFVNTSRWMNNFRNQLRSIWREVLYHGDDYRASLVRNTSTVEIVPRSPFLHRMPGDRQAIEMAFYVAFNRTPISNPQFSVVLNYVQSVRETIQTQLKVRIHDVMPMVSPQLYREVLGDDSTIPMPSPPTSPPSLARQDAANISTDMLGLEIPLGVGIVAAGLAVAFLAIVHSRCAKRKAPGYPALSTARNGLRRDRLSGAERARGNEYGARLPYQGYGEHGVDGKADNPYPGPAALAQRIHQVRDAETAGPIVVYDSPDTVVQNPAALLQDEPGGGGGGGVVPTAPASSATLESIRMHPPNTTPL